jgi:hypothetical protein
MISSIGALNLATIERLSGHAGILSLTCHELLGHITVMFGALHASDVFYIENVIKEELSSFSTFRDFISRNSLNYDILAKIPHPISDITKIQWLENSLQRCPQFDIPIGTWKSLNTSVAARSYDKLVQYLSDQYSSLPPDTPSRGGKAFGATDGSSSTAQGPDRKRKRNRGKGKGKGGDKNNKRQQQQQAPTRRDCPAFHRRTRPISHRLGRRTSCNGWPTASMDQQHRICIIERIRPRRPETNSHSRSSFLLRCARAQHYPQWRHLPTNARRSLNIHHAASPGQETQ